MHEVSASKFHATCSMAEHGGSVHSLSFVGAVLPKRTRSPNSSTVLHPSGLACKSLSLSSPLCYLQLRYTAMAVVSCLKVT